MKRRVLVGQALVHRPPVIILDEPTAGVDVELRQELWKFIRELNGAGHTIVLTTHYLEEAEALCGRIAMLKQGRIVALDETANLLQRLLGGARAGASGAHELPAALVRFHAGDEAPCACCRCRTTAGGAGAGRRARRPGCGSWSSRSCRRISRTCSCR